MGFKGIGYPPTGGKIPPLSLWGGIFPWVAVPERAAFNAVSLRFWGFEWAGEGPLPLAQSA